MPVQQGDFSRQYTMHQFMGQIFCQLVGNVRTCVRISKSNTIYPVLITPVLINFILDENNKAHQVVNNTPCLGKIKAILYSRLEQCDFGQVFVCIILSVSHIDHRRPEEGLGRAGPKLFIYSCAQNENMKESGR